MAKSHAELREQLSSIEARESMYEGIGPSDVDLLTRMVEEEPEDWLAARAVHALSRIESGEARAAVASAARSPRMEVRVAAATCAAELPVPEADDILGRLLDDPQPGVRKFAVRATSARNGEAIRSKVRDMATSEASASLRRTAARKSQTDRDA